MTDKKLDRVYGDNLEDYQKLKKTPFFDKEENATIFIMAMALGFKNGSKVPLKKGKEGIARLTYFKESQIIMIKALALKDTKDVEILLDDEKIFKIAEEYANGGMKFLKSLLIGEEPGSYIKKISSELMSIVKKLDLK